MLPGYFISGALLPVDLITHVPHSTWYSRHNSTTFASTPNALYFRILSPPPRTFPASPTYIRLHSGDFLWYVRSPCTESFLPLSILPTEPYSHPFIPSSSLEHLINLLLLAHSLELSCHTPLSRTCSEPLQLSLWVSDKCRVISQKGTGFPLKLARRHSGALTFFQERLRLPSSLFPLPI